MAHSVFGHIMLHYVLVDLFRIEISYLLLRNTCLIVLYSFSLFMTFKFYVPILKVKVK